MRLDQTYYEGQNMQLGICHRNSRYLKLAFVVGSIVTSSVQPLLADPVKARPTLEFLESVGINTTTPDRGQPMDRTVSMLRFAGFRWVRAGIEGLTDSGPTNLTTYLDMNRQTGVKFSWGLGSGATDLNKLITTARVMAKAGTLIAIEGNNEPNNWPITYEGETGGRGNTSWMPVAKLQRDLYRIVKADPELSALPVWSPSEVGAQYDNVGLQFLKIPPGAGTLMPDGTAYADAANLHNYFYHSNASTPADNKTWDAADPTSANRVDGLYANFGKTWGRGFKGYDASQLLDLPRVTTETGVPVGGAVSEHMHGTHLTNLYLSQFKRGYSFTAAYILRDRTDEGGNQGFGFFRSDYTPRPAAVYLHNLTTLLDDHRRPANLGELDYRIQNQPRTVHDLLLQNSDGSFRLVIWGEQLKGENSVSVQFNKEVRASLYDPIVGTQPLEAPSLVKSMNLTLSDHPIVLAITAQ